MEVEEINNKKGKEERKGTGAGIGTNNGINSGVESREDAKETKISEEIAKITITKSSESKLMALLADANDGFETGRVNRQSLASWIIDRTCDDYDSTLIEEVRNDHFDEFMMLEAILRKGKADGKLPTEFQSLLKSKAVQGSSQKLKARKTLTKTYINDVLPKEAEKE